MTPAERDERMSQLLDQLIEHERRIAQEQADSYRVLAELRELDGAQNAGVRFLSADLAHRSLRAEIAAALRLGERTVEARMALADDLVHALPATLTALSAGTISDRHARAMSHETAGLEPEVRVALESQLLPRAERLNPARFTAALVEARELLDPDEMPDRHEAAMQHRSVWVCAERDGMSTLGLLTDAVSAQAIYDRFTRASTAELERTRAQGCDDRTLTQARADLATAALLTADLAELDPAIIGPVVHLTVPMLTLLDADTRPAHLDGYGPIDVETAARLVGTATSFTRVLTDPVTEEVLAFDRTRYRPTTAQRGYLARRGRTCSMVGCGQPAVRCDIDHTVEWHDGGRTDVENLAPLCQGHHTLKTHTGWRYRHADEAGTLEWTSPLQRRYTVDPPGVLRPADTRWRMLSRSGSDPGRASGSDSGGGSGSTRGSGPGFGPGSSLSAGSVEDDLETLAAFELRLREEQREIDEEAEWLDARFGQPSNRTASRAGEHQRAPDPSMPIQWAS